MSATPGSSVLMRATRNSSSGSKASALLTDSISAVVRATQVWPDGQAVTPEVPIIVPTAVMDMISASGSPAGKHTVEGSIGVACGLGRAVAGPEAMISAMRVAKVAENMMLRVAEGLCRAMVLVFSGDIEVGFIPLDVFVTVCSVDLKLQESQANSWIPIVNANHIFSIPYAIF